MTGKVQALNGLQGKLRPSSLPMLITPPSLDPTATVHELPAYSVFVLPELTPNIVLTGPTAQVFWATIPYSKTSTD